MVDVGDDMRECRLMFGASLCNNREKICIRR